MYIFFILQMEAANFRHPFQLAPEIAKKVYFPACFAN